VISHAPGVVLLDEAYAEYSSGGLLRHAPEHPRLLAIRTLSKAFGLAGLRIGYTTGPTQLVHEVEKSRGPYKVSGVSERAALAVLENDRAWVQEGVDTVLKNRARFRDELARMGLAPLPSEANFVLVPVQDAAWMTKQLRELGVAVRPFIGLYGIGDAVRISIGAWELMEKTLDALREVLS
jgi:histidinol-phosphate aminotransferase